LRVVAVTGVPAESVADVDRPGDLDRYHEPADAETARVQRAGDHT
jgi:hypothetical protein